MIVGLTGQIGAGKTSAARILARFGARIVDADKIGHEVLDQSPPLSRKLARAFGPEILDKRGRVNRKRLASLAFADETGKRNLNELVHPYLLRELRNRVRRLSKSHGILVIDAALLLYWDMDREVDFVLVVHASRQQRLERMKARGISRSDAAARERAQLPFAEFRSRADCLLLNNGTVEKLEGKLRELWSRISAWEASQTAVLR